jgi:hypothetical protein
MTLRLFLLTLVGLMSFELPNGLDVSSWIESGGRWFDSRMADLDHLKTEMDRAYNGSIEPELTVESSTPVDSLAVEIARMRADVTFENVVEGQIAEFRTDLAAIEAARPLPDEAPVVIAVETPAPSVEPPDPGCFDQEIEIDPPVNSVPMVEQGASIERLNSAVRLTRQALSAWASLIEPNPEDMR